MAASTTTRPLAAFTDEQLIAYSETWRRLARMWTRMAKGSDVTRRGAERLRTTAHAALHAAHEAEELLKIRLASDDASVGPRARRRPGPPRAANTGSSHRRPPRAGAKKTTPNRS